MGKQKPLECSRGAQTYRNTPVSLIRTITVGWDSHPSCLAARRLSGSRPVYCRWRLSLRPETERSVFLFPLYYTALDCQVFIKTFFGFLRQGLPAHRGWIPCSRIRSKHWPTNGWAIQAYATPVRANARCPAYQIAPAHKGRLF